MLVGAVRIDLVDDDLEPERVRALDQRVEVGERAEHRIDVAIIGDVVAEVAHRRGEEGRQPDRVDAEARDIIELRGDARQVADAVAVRYRRSCAGRSDRSPRRATTAARLRPALAALTSSASIAHRIAERRKARRARCRAPDAAAGQTPASVSKCVERVSTRTFCSTGAVDVLNSSSISRPVAGIEARHGEQPRLVLRIADQLQPAGQRAMAGADARERQRSRDKADDRY